METRIVGGVVAASKRYPYYMDIRVGRQTPRPGYYYSYYCGGSLVARDVVLTTASCLDGASANISDVRVNVSSVEQSKYEYMRGVRKFVLHPNYKRLNHVNDVGLVFLDKPVTSVPLVKLNRNASVPRSINPPFLTAIGVGANDTMYGNEAYRTYTDLKQVSIKPASMALCKQEYGSNLVGESILCAGGVKGVCTGDVGGPLLLKKSSAEKDVQIGIISSKYKCPKQAGHPDLFVRVSYYAKWVDAQICKYSKKKPSTCPTMKPTAKPTVKPVI